MRKSDESIRNIVTATIKRHSMHRENWLHTQIWDQWSETITEFIAKKIPLTATELEIIGYLESESYGYLITTQHIYIFENHLVRTIKLDEIENYQFGMNFKGYREQKTETITLQLKNGRTDQFRFETGYPSMGAIYALMTVLSVGQNP